MKNYVVKAKELREYVEKIFQAVGLKKEEAESVAELLVHADLRNVRSHGVLRTVPYVEKIKDGGASKVSTYPVVHETANTAVIDAQGGLGALAGDDMIGFACSNTDLTMGPPNCKEPFMGNNPFSFAFKAGEKYPEVCVDMATSGVAFGKCKDLAKRGKEIPSGWMLDKDGNDTTKLEDCFMMTPMAGHKGFGIAFVVELFATLLSGGVLSPDINNQDLTNTPELSSQCFACFNISAFRDLKEFQETAENYIDRLHELPMKEGAAKYPGEIEYTNKKINEKEGVVLPETLVDDLIGLGKEFDIAGEFLKETVTDRQ